ncbi:MAG: prolyl oligopeptidase family serine peptidase [Catenulispora sp.]|nr:prolyl oligopeptidase family serine peptidase [Catenulispora sp.]
MRLTGLKAGAAVTITSDAVDLRKVRWHGSGRYQADASGVVDLAKQASTAGTYTGVDETGLMWSMDPDPEPAANTALTIFDTDSSSPYSITLTATADKASATLTLTRIWRVPGVTEKMLTVAADGFAGELFLPPPTADPRPAMMLLGGSEGGPGPIDLAEMLAAKGYPALCVGYFGVPGTPAALQNIPLEYFTKAAQYLADQPAVDRAHIIVTGISRGTEAALLLAQNYPHLFHGAVVIAPSSVVNDGLPRSPFAWTLHGEGLPQGLAIPVDKISGPVLAFAGDDDQLWASYLSAPKIAEELDAAHNPFPHKAVIYPNAGHFISADPSLPLLFHHIKFGGTRPGNAAGQADVWNQLPGLLKSLSS